MNRFWVVWALTSVVLIGMDVSGFDELYAEEFPWWGPLAVPFALFFGGILADLCAP